MENDEEQDDDRYGHPDHPHQDAFPHDSLSSPNRPLRHQNEAVIAPVPQRSTSLS
jgi:hypothetical protein